jgi:hypothetical protein
MEICKTESSNTTNEMMVELMITNLWQVTEFVASHTAVEMQGSKTHNMIESLAKLREQIRELRITN